MHAAITAVEYYLPERMVTTEDLVALFPDREVRKTAARAGIAVRHVAHENQFSSDLAAAAAGKLFASGACTPQMIDFIVVCTQSPDYILPSTACLLQDRLGIAKSAGAFDINLGCSGYVYSLGVAEALISSGQASGVLLLTADTYSKYIAPSDLGARILFGDGASATFLRAMGASSPSLAPFVYGTDGSGARELFVAAGGKWGTNDDRKARDGWFTDLRLQMNGAQVFEFALRVVPNAVDLLLKKAHFQLEEVDLFIFHQANKCLLEELRRLVRIPPNRFHITLSHCGNTASSTIPIALKHAEEEGRLRPGATVALVGFGVGLSWAATLIRWV